MSELLDDLRRIDLLNFVEGYGYRLDSKRSGKAAGSDRVMRRDADKLLVKERSDGWVWCSCRNTSERGSIVDFVRKEHSCGFVEAIQRLRGDAGALNSSPPHKSLKRAEPAQVEPTTDPYKQTAAVWNSAQWNPAPAYLLSRGLASATLADPIFRDCYRVDRNGNVLFPHHDTGGMCGYERRGPDCKAFGKDTRRGLWRSANLWSATTTEIVICEAPIDAMSHYQLYGGSLAYVATGGSLGSRQLELLTLLFRRATRDNRVWITCGMDNDPPGGSMFQQIALIAPGKVHRLTPIGKDWNADLVYCNRENE